MKVVIPVFSGVEELDAVGPFEVFGLARAAGMDVNVRMVSCSGEALTGFHGLQIGGLGGLGDDADCVIVPGGAWVSGREEGVRLAIREGVLAPWIAACHARGAVVASVCTGVFLLHAAGLLDGVPATTHHLALEDLRALGVNAVADRVVDAGRVLTTGGIASGLDLSLWILEREFGKDAAGLVEKMLEYRRQGSVLKSAV